MGASLVAQMVKNPPANARDPGSIPGRSPGEEKATHYNTLARRISWREAWQATVHGVAKSQTQLSD